MQIVFMGTPGYAQVSLQALLDAGYQVVGVFTQPDRPKGRGGKVSMPPVKELAERHGIPVYQPGRIRSEGLEDLKNLRPDLCVTAAFGQILSGEILGIPPLGTVNVHASLLPRYRGSSPVNWAIMMETETGVTTMLTEKGIDTGDILLQEKTRIGVDETAGELTARLAAIGADLLIRTLKLIQAGTCPRTPQNEGEMSYYPMLKKETGAINWQKTATEIANQVRGLNPWPCAYAFSPWGTLKILQAKAQGDGSGALPGMILTRESGWSLNVQTGEGILRILTVQSQGGRAMPAADFLRGHPLPEGGRMENGEQVYE